MSQQPSFSFDLYPGLDAELTAAYERNVGQDAATQAAAHLGSVVQAAIQEQDPRGEAMLSPEFDVALAEANEASTRLFVGRSNIPYIPEWESAAFESVDWAKLDKAYNIMTEYGLEPEIVISPTGDDGFWRKVYADLPGTKNGGLYIDQTVARSWDEIADTAWSVTVIPATSKPPVTDVAHETATPGALNKGLPLKVVMAADKQGTSTVGDISPSINEYLTLQGVRLNDGRPPIDSANWTWLRRAFDNGTKAPFAYWNPVNAQVRVNWDSVDFRNGGLGVRPAVRGIEP